MGVDMNGFLKTSALDPGKSIEPDPIDSAGNDAAIDIKEHTGVPGRDRGSNFPHPANALRNGNLPIGAVHVGLHPLGAEDGQLHSKTCVFAVIARSYRNPISVTLSKASLINDDNVRVFNGLSLSDRYRH